MAKLITDRDRLLHRYVCRQYNINPDRRFRMHKGDNVVFVFEAETPPASLAQSMDELVRLLKDEFRAPVLKAAVPETYNKIEAVVKAYSTTYDIYAINLDTKLVKEILHETIFESYSRRP